MLGYKKFFEIILSHTFFNESKCKVLNISPTDATTLFLHNADLIFKTTHQGISVSYNTDFTASLVAYLDDDIVLSFRIKSTDPYFYNYTDFDHVNGSSLYFNSESTREKGGVFILSKEDNVTASDEKVITDPLFYGVLTKVDKITNPVGIINIRLADLISGNGSLESYESKKYSINFNAKSTFWRYNLIKNNDIDYDELLIQDIDQKLEFEKGDQVSLLNGILANQIISKQAIVLKEFSDFQLNLIGIRNKQEKLLIKRLSVPDVKQITIEEEKKISELYIYY